jgi:flagellar hook-basal body complex protein FliE
MVTMSTGTFTNLEAIEIVDSESMTAAMETANKVVSAYQAPNK